MNRLFRASGSAALIFAVAFNAATSLAQTFGGNLLPNQAAPVGPPGPNQLPKTIMEIQNTAVDTDMVQKYVGNAGANGGPFRGQPTGGFMQPPVLCEGMPVGTMYFEFGAYTGNLGGMNGDSGGMVIRGGFKFNNDKKLNPGHSLRWLQAFRETGGNNTTTIDGNPLYPNHSLAGYDSLFFDAPADVFTNPNTPDSIVFEAALVCFDNANPMALHALGSFLWGYNIDKVNKTITGEYALIFTPPLGGLLTTTFTNEFGPMGTRGMGWTLDSNCADCFMMIPEPNVLILVGQGLALVLIGRRNGLRTQC